MKANLETVPKFRITFTREPGDDLTLPEELGAERQPDGGWHLWDNSEPFNGIVIPAEAVGPLVSILNGFDRYVAPLEPVAAPAEPTVEPDPGYRRVVPGEISRDGDLWKYPDGRTIPGTPGLIHCDQTCGAILQRLDPGAIAPGHNPDRLTVAQVGIAEGWRLLTPAEVKEFRCKEVIPAEFWSTGWNSGCSWFVTSDSTLRTKAEKLEVVWSRS